MSLDILIANLGCGAIFLVAGWVFACSIKNEDKEPFYFESCLGAVFFLIAHVGLFVLSLAAFGNDNRIFMGIPLAVMALVLFGAAIRIGIVVKGD